MHIDTSLRFPTPDLNLNGLLRDFVTSVQSILGANFVAAYLQGSFAVGDWDEDSDVDFTVVTEQDVSDAAALALQRVRRPRLSDKVRVKSTLPLQ
jgi:predicted nucleotidyltransferase